MEKNKKFNMVEIVLGTLFMLGVDIICAVLDLFVIGMVAAVAIQAGASLGTTMWLLAKGSKRATRLEKQLIKQASNVLPVVPTCTLAFLIEALLHNHPKSFKKFAKIKK